MQRILKCLTEKSRFIKPSQNLFQLKTQTWAQMMEKKKFQSSNPKDFQTTEDFHKAITKSVSI